MRETTWPVPLFAGRADGSRFVGLDLRGDQLELVDERDALVGPQMRLTPDVAASADAGAG